MVARFQRADWQAVRKHVKRLAAEYSAPLLAGVASRQRSRSPLHLGFERRFRPAPSSPEPRTNAPCSPSSTEAVISVTTKDSSNSTCGYSEKRRITSGGIDKSGGGGPISSHRRANTARATILERPPSNRQRGSGRKNRLSFHCTRGSATRRSILRKVLGLYRKRSGEMSFEQGTNVERRSVFDRAT